MKLVGSHPLSFLSESGRDRVAVVTHSVQVPAQGAHFLFGPGPHGARSGKNSISQKCTGTLIGQQPQQAVPVGVRTRLSSEATYGGHGDCVVCELR